MVTHDRAALLAWNAANRRARDEYHAYPIAACNADDCYVLVGVKPRCKYHSRLENAA